MTRPARPKQDKAGKIIAQSASMQSAGPESGASKLLAANKGGFIDPQAVHARALGIALQGLSHDDLLYRLAGQSIVIEQITKVAHEAIAVAVQESTISTSALALTEKLRPLLDQGRAFTMGRKPGSSGPVRKAIARLLAKNPGMKNRDLLAAIKQNPPKGWQVEEFTHFDYPPEIVGPKREIDRMGYERFCNVAAEERKKAKAKITG